MNFKEYFSQDKKTDPILKMGTGSKHHQTVGRLTTMGNRKSLNFVAKSQSQPKKSLHPKVDLCLKLKKNIPLVGNEPFDIMDKYKLCPTPEEPTKIVNGETPVGLQMVKPNVYILVYKGE